MDTQTKPVYYTFSVWEDFGDLVSVYEGRMVMPGTEEYEQVLTSFKQAGGTDRMLLPDGRVRRYWQRLDHTWGFPGDSDSFQEPYSC